MEEIAKIKHQDIENAKNEESIRASQESQSLAKKNLTMQEEAHKSSQALQAAHVGEIQRKSSEEGLRSSALQRWVAEQRAPMDPRGVPPSGEAIDPNLVSAAEAGGPSTLAQIILGTQRKEATQGNVVNVIQGREAVQEKKSETTKTVGEAERKSREIIAAAGVASKEKIGEKERASTTANVKTKVESAEKIADKMVDAKEAGAKTKVYWDETEQAPVKLVPGKEDPATQWDPDKSKIAKRKIEGFRRAGSTSAPEAAAPATKPLPKF
jgi:hypothetical protein